MVAGSHTVLSGGRPRTYAVRRPSSHRPAPLVVVLHGAGSDGRNIERDSGFTPALRSRAALLYPDGLHNTWNAGGCCLQSAAEGVDDVGFVSSLVRAAIEAGVADPDRIYVAGFSNGGMLAYDLLCSSTVHFAGAEVVGAAVVSRCPNDLRGTNLVVVHDRRDVMVRPAGYDGDLPTGQHLHYPSLLETSVALRRRLGCRGEPNVIDHRGVESQHWAACAAGGDLTVELLDGVGHTWPGNRSVPAHAHDPVDATANAIRLLNI